MKSDTLASLLSTLKSAKKYGVSSLAQLDCFITVAAHQGLSIEEMISRKPSDSEYRIFLSTVRKLMAHGYRGADGLGLLIWSDKSKSMLTLTPRGTRLLKQLQKVAER